MTEREEQYKQGIKEVTDKFKDKIKEKKEKIRELEAVIADLKDEMQRM